MNAIYVKAPKKVTIKNKSIVLVKDIVELEGNNELMKNIGELQVIELKDNKKKNVLISILDITKVINDEYPDLFISNLGEADIILSYQPSYKEENNIYTIIKVVFVCMILFCGATVAIISFHTDAAIPNVFITLNRIFTGKEIERPYMMLVPYSIGLSTGIIVFFNHFSSKRLSDDPTPIEVELRSYEKDVEDCIIETLAMEKKDS